MLPFLLVLAVVGFLFFLGISVSMYLYKSGTLGSRFARRSRRSKLIESIPANLDTESQEAIDEAEYYINLVHSWEG